MPGSFWESTGGSPKVSPNKSLEGYIGGILSGALFLLLYGVILRQFAGLEVSLPVMAVYGLLGSAVTELGDLSFSPDQAAVRHQGLWESSSGARRDAGPVRLYDLRGPHAAYSGDAAAGVLSASQGALFLSVHVYREGILI